MKPVLLGSRLRRERSVRSTVFGQALTYLSVPGGSTPAANAAETAAALQVPADVCLSRKLDAARQDCVKAALVARQRQHWAGQHEGSAAWDRAAWGRAAWGRAARGQAAWGRATLCSDLQLGDVIHHLVDETPAHKPEGQHRGTSSNGQPAMETSQHIALRPSVGWQLQREADLSRPQVWMNSSLVS